MVNVSFSSDTIAHIDRFRAATPGRPEVKRAAWVAWATDQWIKSQAPAASKAPRRSIVEERTELRRAVPPPPDHEGARLRAARMRAGLSHGALAQAASIQGDCGKGGTIDGEQVSRGQVQRAERAASLDGYPALRT